jgi:hypothetical protein
MPKRWPQQFSEQHLTGTNRRPNTQLVGALLSPDIGKQICMIAAEGDTDVQALLIKAVPPNPLHCKKLQRNHLFCSHSYVVNPLVLAVSVHYQGTGAPKGSEAKLPSWNATTTNSATG